MKKIKKLDFWNYSSYFILALFVVFLIFPLAGLLKEAIYTSDTGFTFSAFQKFFSRSYYYSTIGNSLKIAIATTVISLALGVPFAYFYSFYKLKGRKFLFIMLLLCTMSAPFIGAYAWILLMGNNGLITNILKIFNINHATIYGFGGIVMVQSLKLFPLIVLYMNGAFRDIDSSLIEAASSMGVKGHKFFFKILLSLTMPTILAGSLLVFMRSFADFGTPLLIGRGFSTFPVLIFNEYLGENGSDYHFAAAISLIAVFITGVIFLIQKIATSKFKFTMSAMHPFEVKETKGATGILMHIFAYGTVAISMLPQFYVIYMSFRKYNSSILLKGYSLVNYVKAFEKNLIRATGNTLIISFITVAIIIVISVFIAYLVVRRSNVISQAIDSISMLPYIMPGAVVGIALVLVYSKKPFSIGGTLLIMILALTIRRLPFTSRATTATMMKISPSIEEAAISLGASKLKSFVQVTVPMMKSGIIAGAVLSWVSIITEMSSGVILYNNRTITLTIGTYVSINNGIYGVAAAYATITTLMTIICLVLYLKFTKIEDVSM